MLNAGNWAVYIGVMGMTIDQIRPFALLMFAISFVTALLYITIQLYRDGHDLNLRRIGIRSGIALIILGSAASYILLRCPPSAQQFMLNALDAAGTAVQWCAGFDIGLLFLTAAI